MYKTGESSDDSKQDSSTKYWKTSRRRKIWGGGGTSVISTEYGNNVTGRRGHEELHNVFLLGLSKSGSYAKQANKAVTFFYLILYVLMSNLIHGAG
jgi:hypothetical protein